MSDLMLDAEALYGELRGSVRSLLQSGGQSGGQSAGQSGGQPGAVLVGIWSGGAWLAERLQADLGLPGHAGVISSSLHRDDFGSRGLAARADATRLPFSVAGSHIVLVDDVLHTGRTIRAVINELYDFGRPASVKLAVLVDRGGRELPIQADVAAARVSLSAQQSLRLARLEDGRFTFSVKQGA